MVNKTFVKQKNKKNKMFCFTVLEIFSLNYESLTKTKKQRYASAASLDLLVLFLQWDDVCCDLAPN